MCSFFHFCLLNFSFFSFYFFRFFRHNLIILPYSWTNDLDSSCAFLVDFNDGRREIITTNNNSVTHVYKSEGKFTVKLTSEPRCLHDIITANIDVNLPFGNASLACPTLMETSETNSSCTLSVIGSEIDVILDSIFLGTMSGAKAKHDINFVHKKVSYYGKQ